MSTGIYVAYLLISIGLTIVVGMALSRSARVFLTEALGGNRALAGAVNRLLMVGFYLLTLGFIALVMRPPGAITSAAQAAQVLSIKIGEVLLVLGAAHLAGVAVVRRFARRTPAPPSRPAPPRTSGSGSGSGAAAGSEPASVPEPRAWQDVH